MVNVQYSSTVLYSIFCRHGCILFLHTLVCCLSLSTLPHAAYPNPKKQKGHVGRNVTRLTTFTHTDFKCTQHFRDEEMCSMPQWEGKEEEKVGNSHVLRSTYHFIHPTSHPCDVTHNTHTQTRTQSKHPLDFISTLANTAQKEGAKEKRREVLVDSRMGFGSYLQQQSDRKEEKNDGKPKKKRDAMQKRATGQSEV